MPSKLRVERIAARIREEISEMFVTGQITDPRLNQVFVTDVTVDRELMYANIFVSAIEGQESSRQILEGLEHAGGFLRSALSKRIELRSFPKLRFFWDETPERAERIEKLIDSLSDDQPEADASDD